VNRTNGHFTTLRIGNATAEVFATPIEEKLLTREELARALQVSVRTVGEMIAAEEIPVVRIRKWTVRFCLADVVRALTVEPQSKAPGLIAVGKAGQS
jgi:excisionase family DNA binding protein